MTVTRRSYTAFDVQKSRCSSGFNHKSASSNTISILLGTHRPSSLDVRSCGTSHGLCEPEEARRLSDAIETIRSQGRSDPLVTMHTFSIALPVFIKEIRVCPTVSRIVWNEISSFSGFHRNIVMIGSMTFFWETTTIFRQLKKKKISFR